MAKIFVCVGPNRGDREMVKLMHGHDLFIMFEPLPEAAAWLRDHNRHAEQWFHVIEAACGEHAGRATLNVYNFDGVSSSLGKCTDQARQLYSGADLSGQHQIEVDVINLREWLDDHQVEHIQTLLIDAQGMDLAILKTIEPYLRERRIDRIVHEIDGDGFRHYDGLPDNSFSAAIEFFDSVGNYEMEEMPDGNSWNFDVSWRLKDVAVDATQKAT